MRLSCTKILLILLTGIFVSCNTIKRVGEGEHLLIRNTIQVDSAKVSDRRVYSQLEQEPNATLPLIGFPLKLQIYNTAKPHPDSVFQNWLYKKPKREKHLVNFLSRKQVDKLGQNYVNWQEFKKQMGEKPTIVDSAKTDESVQRLKDWYWSMGWFDTKISYQIDTLRVKRAKITYDVERGEPYTLDSLSVFIQSEVIDSLYENTKSERFIRRGEPFRALNFQLERQRLTRLFRNNGLYYFDQDNITFNADTLGTGHRVNIETVIANREVKQQDTTVRVPFKIRRISDVNIFTNYVEGRSLLPITDSIHYDSYKLYSSGFTKYRPRALTNAIFIKKGNVFSDRNRSLTYDRMTDIGIFQYPEIKYMEDPRDSTNTDLIANIFLKPRKKFGMTYDLDVSRSNIQDFGIRAGTSLLVRNIFHGLETLEFGVRASIGSSTDASVTTRNRFFNISEVGGDLRLNVPKIIFPFNVDRIIPKSMSPFTVFSTGMSLQHNIGLDKQSMTAKYSFKWRPDREQDWLFNLVDLQYVRNLNTKNYFNVFRNSFDRLNRIAQDHVESIDPSYFEEDNPLLSPSPKLIIAEGVDAFIDDYKRGTDFNLTGTEDREARALIERKDRLSENNLIFGSSIDYTKNTRKNIYDEQFTQFRIHFEAVGNSLALLSSALGRSKKDGYYNIAGVRFSQYLKTEISFIKHWDLGQKNILAFKAMGGIAIPYGNANSVPFVRSFFAGGANDNRGWRPYDLGPGSSGGLNEFNEANMKLGANLEYRFNLFGSLNSAFFVDVGNIWNVLDNVKDERSRFSGIEDLKELAIGTGIGLRYDFDFFVIRVDLGFKTYDPAFNKQKWFNDYNFAHSVLNIGINYPF